MKIESKKFYVVVAGEEAFVEQTRAEAISTLRKSLKEAGSENPQIAEVDISGEKWSMQGLAWKDIAMELLKGE